MANLRVLSTALLFLSPTVPAGSEDARPKSAPPAAAQADQEVLYVRLALPERAPLNDQQIRATLAEHKLVLDDQYSPAPNIKIRTAMLGGCPPKERFFGDGRWERTVCGLTYQTHRGSWSVRDSRVCVRAENVADECRRVWRTSSPGRLILSVPISPTDFNPYLLTALAADPRSGP
jgi:hypothetical protein